MKSKMSKIYFIAVVWSYYFLPVITKAAGFVPCGGSGEPECEACHFVKMANDIITWLIGILFIVFAIVLVVSGFMMVISGGKPEAKTNAKNKITNAFVGLVIVLSAWLLVDTLMRVLLAGNDGEISGYGPWTDISCGTSVAVKDRVTDQAPLCTDCVDIPNDIYTKGEALICSIKNSPGGRCKLNSGLIEQIRTFQGKLKGKGLSLGGANYRLTEAWPPTGYSPDDPTGIHKSSCHGDGTCFDFGKAGGSSAEDLALVLEAADEAGLGGFYEVSNQSEKDALLSELEGSDNYQYVKDHIKVTGTPPHFHLIMGAGYVAKGGTTGGGSGLNTVSAGYVEKTKEQKQDVQSYFSEQKETGYIMGALGGVIDSSPYEELIDKVYVYAEERGNNGSEEFSFDDFVSWVEDKNQESLSLGDHEAASFAYSTFIYYKSFKEHDGEDFDQIDKSIRSQVSDEMRLRAITFSCNVLYSAENRECKI